MIEFVSMYAQPAALADFSALRSAFAKIRTPTHFALRVESTLATPVDSTLLAQLREFVTLVDREMDDHFSVHLELAGDLVPAMLDNCLPAEIYDLSLDCVRLRLDGRGSNATAETIARAIEREADHHFVLRNFPRPLLDQLAASGSHFGVLGPEFLRGARYASVAQGIAVDSLDAALSGAAGIASASLPVRNDWIDLGQVAATDTDWNPRVAASAVRAMAAATYIGIDQFLPSNLRPNA